MCVRCVLFNTTARHSRLGIIIYTYSTDVFADVISTTNIKTKPKTTSCISRATPPPRARPRCCTMFGTECRRKPSINSGDRAHGLPYGKPLHRDERGVKVAWIERFLHKSPEASSRTPCPATHGSEPRSIRVLLRERERSQPFLSVL